MKNTIIFILTILLIGTWSFLFLTSKSKIKDDIVPISVSQNIIESEGPKFPPSITTDNGQKVEVSGPMLPP